MVLHFYVSADCSVFYPIEEHVKIQRSVVKEGSWLYCSRARCMQNSVIFVSKTGCLHDVKTLHKKIGDINYNSVLSSVCPKH